MLRSLCAVQDWSGVEWTGLCYIVRDHERVDGRVFGDEDGKKGGDETTIGPVKSKQTTHEPVKGPGVWV